MNEIVRVECKIDDPNGKMPWRKRDTDAGYDLYSCMGVTINPGSVESIYTGIRISTPPGWYYIIHGRSSMFANGIIALQAVIDATYTGPIYIMLYNISDQSYCVDIGDRIAQIIFHNIVHANIVEIERFSDQYDVRGESGWGESGK